MSLFGDIKRRRLLPQEAVMPACDAMTKQFTGGAPLFIDVTGIRMEREDFTPTGNESALPPFMDCWLEWRDYMDDLGVAGCRVRAHKPKSDLGIGALLQITVAIGVYKVGRYGAMGEAWVPLTGSGSMVTSDDRLAVELFRAMGGEGELPNESVICLKQAFKMGHNLDPGRKDGELDCIGAGVNVALHTFELLNCANIALEQTNSQPSRRSKAASTGSPGIRWHRLVIVTPGVKRSGQHVLTTGTGERFTAAHLARGHFKTYTPDAPLFGKYTGRYWWSPHVRGDKAHGVVLKDYEVRERQP